MSKQEIKKEKNHLESVTDKIGEIAVQYGFTVIKPPHVESEDISKLKHFKEYDYYEDAVEKIALTRWYMDNRLDLEAQPVAIYYKKPLPGNPTKKKSLEAYGFEIMGSTRSTSEALLIKCILAVLNDLGYEDLYVDINSIGDRESIVKFERELGGYFRKNVQALPSKLRLEFKKNNYSMLREDYPEIKEIKDNAPVPVSSLSEFGRTHFKEVLECLEAFDLSYKIKPSALSNKMYASHTVFEIRKLIDKNNEVTTDGELLAYGYRYNHLAKKLGGKREIPSIGATIMVKRDAKMSKKVLIKNIKKPKFYLVQLGGLAKLKALNVLEMLRRQKIAVFHSITKDKITGQLNGAEYMKATHVLIMGQKEAIENSMVVRNLTNREQETVMIDKLGDFLKGLTKLKK